MFRTLLCPSSGGQNCIIQHLVSSHCTGWKRTAVLSQSVHRTATYKSSHNLCTGRHDTRCYIIQFWPPDVENNRPRNM